MRILSVEKGEDVRRKGALWAAWGGWLGALFMTVIYIIGVIDRPFSILIVLGIGIGVVGSQVLTRMRLQRVISEVFVTGLRTATSLHGATEQKIRELHQPQQDDGLPAQVCTECAQRYPCETIQMLDS